MAIPVHDAILTTELRSLAFKLEVGIKGLVKELERAANALESIDKTLKAEPPPITGIGIEADKPTSH